MQDDGASGDCAVVDNLPAAAIHASTLLPILPLARSPQTGLGATEDTSRAAEEKRASNSAQSRRLLELACWPASTSRHAHARVCLCALALRLITRQGETRARRGNGFGGRLASGYIGSGMLAVVTGVRTLASVSLDLARVRGRRQRPHLRPPRMRTPPSRQQSRAAPAKFASSASLHCWGCRRKSPSLLCVCSDASRKSVQMKSSTA